MKFTITSITEEGVKGKTDNPIPFPDATVSPDVYSRRSFHWYKAEANRKEYKIQPQFIDSNLLNINGKGVVHPKNGMKIEGDIKDNQIINIKLL